MPSPNPPTHHEPIHNPITVSSKERAPCNDFPGDCTILSQNRYCSEWKRRRRRTSSNGPPSSGNTISCSGFISGDLLYRPCKHAMQTTISFSCAHQRDDYDMDILFAHVEQTRAGHISSFDHIRYSIFMKYAAAVSKTLQFSSCLLEISNLINACKNTIFKRIWLLKFNQ